MQTKSSHPISDQKYRRRRGAGRGSCLASRGLGDEHLIQAFAYSPDTAAGSPSNAHCCNTLGNQNLKRCRHFRDTEEAGICSGLEGTLDTLKSDLPLYKSLQVTEFRPKAVE